MSESNKQKIADKMKKLGEDIKNMIFFKILWMTMI